MLWLGRILYFLQSSHRSEDDPTVLRQILTKLASVLFYTVTLGMLAGALLVGLLFALYQYLITLSLEAGIAFAIVALVTLAIALIVGALITCSVRHLLAIPRRINAQQHPIQSFLSSISESFMDGFHEDRPRAKSKRRK